MDFTLFTSNARDSSFRFVPNLWTVLRTICRETALRNVQTVLHAIYWQSLECTIHYKYERFQFSVHSLEGLLSLILYFDDWQQRQKLDNMQTVCTAQGEGGEWWGTKRLDSCRLQHCPCSRLAICFISNYIINSFLKHLFRNQNGLIRCIIEWLMM